MVKMNGALRALPLTALLDFWRVLNGGRLLPAAAGSCYRIDMIDVHSGTSGETAAERQTQTSALLNFPFSRADVLIYLPMQEYMGRKAPAASICLHRIPGGDRG